ncbi:Target of rapamycin complex subunit lst8 [Homalodisca vitripennis]|nr:Target of rapamycin complex subunit lst8 [Homalodisca vitripennis]
MSGIAEASGATHQKVIWLVFDGFTVLQDRFRSTVPLIPSDSNYFRMVLWLRQSNASLKSRNKAVINFPSSMLSVTNSIRLINAVVVDLPFVNPSFECIRIYDVNQSLDSALLTNNNVEKNVLAVGIEEEGKWMYTAGEDNTVRLYDLRALNMKCQKVFQTDATVNCACLHPSQKMMAVGDQKGIIHLWDLKSDHSKQLVPEPGASIQSIAMDPNGKYMAAVTNRGRCFIWELPAMFVEELTLIQHRAMIEAHQRYALRCKFSPDSKSVPLNPYKVTKQCVSTTQSNDLAHQVFYCSNFPLAVVGMILKPLNKFSLEGLSCITFDVVWHILLGAGRQGISTFSGYPTVLQLIDNKHNKLIEIYCQICEVYGIALALKMAEHVMYMMMNEVEDQALGLFTYALQSRPCTQRLLPLFPVMKTWLATQRFDNMELQENVTTWWKFQAAECYNAGIS